MIRRQLSNENAEAQESHENQVNADQIIQNARESENQDAEQQGEQRAQVRSADDHCSSSSVLEYDGHQPQLSRAKPVAVPLVMIFPTANGTLRQW